MPATLPVLLYCHSAKSNCPEGCSALYSANQDGRSPRYPVHAGDIHFVAIHHGAVTCLLDALAERQRSCGEGVPVHVIAACVHRRILLVVEGYGKVELAAAKLVKHEVGSSCASSALVACE